MELTYVDITLTGFIRSGQSGKKDQNLGRSGKVMEFFSRKLKGRESQRKNLNISCDKFLEAL